MLLYNGLKRIYYRSKFRNVVLRRGAVIGGLESSFGGNNLIGQNSFFSGSMGYGSYMGSNCMIYGRIGKYCSIADQVNVVVGSHPTRKFISTHPAFFSTKKQAGFTFTNHQKYEETRYTSDHFLVSIENDVWIGFGAKIMSGLTIHDGAVIAAGSIVTKDVPAYAIVAGAPARIIRYRFNEEQIDKLKTLQWWDLPIDWIEANAKYFDDIDANLEMLIERAKDCLK